jgi:hypothetical protein
MTAEGIESEVPRGSFRRAARRHGFSGSYDTHSSLSPRNSLRKAGQKKRESQLFLCTTFIFVEMLIGVSALECLPHQDSYMLRIEGDGGLIVAHEQLDNVICAAVFRVIAEIWVQQG